ncbi:MAG: dTDP-4-dehydrorhamnose reductase [Gemmatimonadota bacterium]
MRVLVPGARGMLGKEIVATLEARGDSVLGVGHDELDITDGAAVEAFLAQAAPHVVVNCAAYTRVDEAETDEKRATRINALGPENLARACRSVHARLVHFSTDFVFDGRKGRPYEPDDPPAPLSAYGRSKLRGEEAVQAVGGEFLIVRTSWLYGAGGPNFVLSVLERGRRGEPLRIVDDQVGRPTWARNLAAVTADLLTAGARGVFHVTDSGRETTWYEFGRRILELAGVEVPVRAVTSSEWGAAAPRPPYSVLDLAATERFLGRSMEPWDAALKRFLETLDR